MRQFLLVGRTGVGKSSFINSAFGRYVAEISEYEACTKVVEYYAYNTDIGNIRLIDTPGLAEDDESCDINYLSLIKAKVDLDSVYATIYVSRLDETRFRPDEKRTLRLLTEYLGASIWRNTILVLTFSASVSSDQRNNAVSIRATYIEGFLKFLTKNSAINHRFQRFSSCWLIDNVVPDWTSDGVSFSCLFNQ